MWVVDKATASADLFSVKSGGCILNLLYLLFLRRVMSTLSQKLTLIAGEISNNNINGASAVFGMTAWKRSDVDE